MNTTHKKNAQTTQRLSHISLILHRLKKRLNCKSFDWFMNEIAYDVFDKYPKLPPNKFWGEMKNEGSGTCVDTMGRHPPSAIGASGCHGGGGYQLMLLNTEVS